MVFFISMDFEDDCLRRMGPSLDACAESIKQWLLEGRLLVVRFNDDCDGVVSGLQIYCAARAFAASAGIPESSVAGFQVASAVYAKRDSFEDLTRGRDFSSSKVAVVICDLGANAESVEALSALKEAGAKLCILDHHPPSKDALSLCDCYATSYFEDPTGAHTAGLVSFAVAHRIDAASANAEWVSWSLQSDKSTLVAPGGDLDGARALDYLTHFSDFAETAEHYLSKISDGHTIALAARLSREGEKRSLERAMRHAKHSPAGGAVIVVCDLSKCVKKSEYPPKGRCLNLVQDHFSRRFAGQAVVSLGHSDDSVSIRANSLAIAAGFHSNPLIAALKEEFGDSIKSGGGHAAAASIRFDPDMGSVIISRLRELVEAAFSKKEE